ncbi:hypothetical protein AgCh_015946 [Apium graveolens]
MTPRSAALHDPFVGDGEEQRSQASLGNSFPFLSSTLMGGRAKWACRNMISGCWEMDRPDCIKLLEWKEREGKKRFVKKGMSYPDERRAKRKTQSPVAERRSAFN